MTSLSSAEVLADPTAFPSRGSFRDRVSRAFDIVAGDETRLGLAVSGGSDSTALLMLATDWAGPHRTLHVATVDHGLRPEAAEEARQVAALCARLGVLHQTLVWRPDQPATQADARAARHRLLAEWARAHALPLVCLGHTRDDRIETFLIRARAGSHWRGLAGPMPSAPSPVWPEGDGLRLARPLMAFGRQTLRDDLVGRAIPWIEDPSNLATKYERVRMRGLAARLDDAARARIVGIMDRLAELRSAAAGLVREALANHVRASTGEALIDAAAFRNLPAETRLRLTEALVMAVGHASFPPEPRRLDRMAARLTEAGGIGAGATLAGAWVTETGPNIRFRPAPPRRSTPAPPASAGFSLARAKALLGDPRTTAFRV